jgi:hypothetical protein
MDDKALYASHFIRISRRLTGHRVRYYWIFADMVERELPIHSSICANDWHHDGGHPEFVYAASSQILLFDA